ncbi:MAG: UDP-N-acetylmuramate--L-alanine ligase [Draconibacterium sp.]|nr:MAG: UDP-N-acetylmuramate--L-alanine ligase [Draconibacterium sp.]
MDNLQKIKNVYLLGIGGIGMSALARYFNHTGRNVAGYDKTPTPLTNQLIKEGMNIHFEDDISLIPSNWNPNETLAIFTPALPHDHKELSWFREKPISLLKRAKVLGLICNEYKGVAIAGTHGKTTTSTITATILSKNPNSCGAFLGGISKNFNSNILLPTEKSEWIVAEADEFDRSFLHIDPYLALVTSIDADHLDIYDNKVKMQEAFEKFISNTHEEGCLVVHKNVNIDLTKTKAKTYTYAIEGDADFVAENLRLKPRSRVYTFDIKTPERTIKNCQMQHFGLINVENAIGAAALAYFAGASDSEIRKGIADFSGVSRRFDVRYSDKNKMYIDDYAHHPEELSAVINSVRKLYPNKKITGIFQPHLYSRTRDFAKEFAQSLDLLDETVLIPIYPAREEPIENISSKTILDLMKNENKVLLEKKEVAKHIKNSNNEIIMTLGAGDVNMLADKIITVLKKQ